MSVVFRLELERETDGRWIAEVVELPGVLAYGASQDDAIARVQALALRVVADRLENEEAGREYLNISFAAARATGPAPAPSSSSQLSCASTGRSSARPAPTRSSLVPAGPTSSSPSTTPRRSARGCSRASPSTAA